MQSRIFRSLMPVFVILLIAVPACSMLGEPATPVPPTPMEAPVIPVAGQPTIAPPTPVPATATVAVIHTMTPTDPGAGKLVYDVESVGTGPEKRAPYGDSYEWNRLERPFQQDMSYMPDLDIAQFTVANDSNWWYVTIQLIGLDPNHPQGIHYGVELDLDRDGWGDYLIWARPPYTEQWSTLPIQIYEDQNQNTSGLSSGKSDAPFSADGYETLIFDGIAGGSDPDLAWVRINAGLPGTVQFAFKVSWSGSVFMLGTIADAGLKDPRKLDYVDRFTLPEAGSPVRENMYYPLKQLFLVDNTCREAFGFQPTRYEPQICPVPVAPTKTPDPAEPEPDIPFVCPPRPPNCKIWNSATCVCER